MEEYAASLGRGTGQQTIRLPLFGEVSIIQRARIPGHQGDRSTSIPLRRWTAALLAGLLAALPLAAAADSSLQELVAKSLTARPGEAANFEVGVTSSDTTIWAGGSYTLQLIATDPSGTLIASTDPAPGEDAAVPGQTTFVFLGIPIPNGYLGALNVTAARSTIR